MDVTSTKVVAMVLLGAISLVAGMLPTMAMRCMAAASAVEAGGEDGGAVAANRRRKRAERGRMFVSCLSCFAGGVILTTCFTHMMPHVVQDVRHQKGDGLFPETGLNLAEIFILCGFFLIYAVEEFTHLFLQKCCTPRGGRNEKHRLPAVVVSAEEKPMFPLESKGVVLSGSEDSEQSFSKTTDSEKESFQAALRGFLVVLALSLHAVFEGMALGLAQDTASVWFLFFAISSHKYIITFCVGTQFVSSGVRPLLATIYVTTLALISPIGAGIGLGLTESADHFSAQTAVITVLQGLATGTLIYVVFFEIIEKERAKGTNGVLIVTCLVLGFLCILLLQLVEVESGGGGGHGHDAAASQSHHDTADSDQDHDEHGQPLVCLLKFVDQAWVLPKYFACDPETKVLSPFDGSEVDIDSQDHH